MDSKLVVEQMSGRWQIKHPALRPLAAGPRRPPAAWAGSPTWMPRAQNAHADRLANQAMDEASGASRPGAGQLTGALSPGPGPAPRAAARPGLDRGAREPTTTVLLRHGQTPLSAERRFAGRGDIPLTETGELQAKAAAQRLAARGGIDRS